MFSHRACDLLLNTNVRNFFKNQSVMDNLNLKENPSIEDDNTKEAKKRTSYVSRDHKSMVDFVTEIYKNLGHTDYHLNKAIAAVHGLSPDSIKQQLTSCQQYKLLELKFSVGYKITELFKRIYLPVNDTEKRAAIIESLKSPESYTALFKNYEFHILPPVSGLKNHFVRTYQFKEDIAEKTATVFIENLKEYNLLDSRGVLISGMKAPINSAPDTGNDSTTLNSSTEPQKQAEVKNEIHTEYEPRMIDIVIPLKTTKEKAHLLIPEDYQAEDLERISKFVEALK